MTDICDMCFKEAEDLGTIAGYILARVKPGEPVALLDHNGHDVILQLAQDPTLDPFPEELGEDRINEIYDFNVDQKWLLAAEDFSTKLLLTLDLRGARRLVERMREELGYDPDKDMAAGFFLYGAIAKKLEEAR